MMIMSGTNFTIDDDEDDNIVNDPQCSASPSPLPPTTTNNNTITVHLHVTGMMCQRNCASTVNSALLATDLSAITNYLTHDVLRPIDNNIQVQTQITNVKVDYETCYASCTIKWNINNNDVLYKDITLTEHENQMVYNMLLQTTIDVVESVGFDASEIILPLVEGCDDDDDEIILTQARLHCMNEQKQQQRLRMNNDGESSKQIIMSNNENEGKGRHEKSAVDEWVQGSIVASATTI
jgi:hypothetical protein